MERQGWNTEQGKTWRALTLVLLGALVLYVALVQTNAAAPPRTVVLVLPRAAEPSPQVLAEVARVATAPAQPPLVHVVLVQPGTAPAGCLAPVAVAPTATPTPSADTSTQVFLPVVHQVGSGERR